MENNKKALKSLEKEKIKKEKLEAKKQKLEAKKQAKLAKKNKKATKDNKSLENKVNNKSLDKQTKKQNNSIKVQF